MVSPLLREIDDVVIYVLPADAYRVDGVVFPDRADAEAAGHDIAIKKRVALWLSSSGHDELLASYRTVRAQPDGGHSPVPEHGPHSHHTH